MLATQFLPNPFDRTWKSERGTNACFRMISTEPKTQKYPPEQNPLNTSQSVAAAPKELGRLWLSRSKKEQALKTETSN